MATSTLSDNSWQSPADTEPGGGSWHPVEDPTTGWLASDTAPSADSFSGGLDADFSSVVPAGTKAVRVTVHMVVTADTLLYWRPSGDTNVSNTPDASSEWAYRLMSIDASGYVFGTQQVVLWLSSDYKAQLAVSHSGGDIYVAYPVEYLL